MIKPNLAFLLPLALPLHAAKWNGLGDNLLWEDLNNWDTMLVPGATGAAPDESVAIAAPNSGGVLAVSVSTALPNTIKDLRFDAGSGIDSSITINIDADANLNATAANNSLLTINEGGPTDPSAEATVNLEGTLHIGQIRMARDTDGTTSYLNILPDGDLFMTGGGHFVMRTDSPAATAIFTMTGGRFSSGGNRNLEMGTFDSQLQFSGPCQFDGTNLGLRAEVSDEAVHTEKTSLIKVSGSEPTQLLFKSINGWVEDTNTNGTTTFEFVPDAGGVTPLTSLGTIDLAGDEAGGDSPADLVVNLAGFAGGSDIVLFDYAEGGLVGEFGKVTFVGGNATLVYDYTDSTQIALTNITVSDPPRVEITSFILDDEGNATISWTKEAPSYQLEMTTDLSSSNWTIIDAEITTDSYTYTDAFDIGDKLFFRVRVTPAEAP